HMLAAILQQAGYKTGLYTSPHLHDFRERIKINGELCTEEFVVNFVGKIRPYLASIQPSFFEITVAMAFQYFVESKIDIAVIETGLGGRLDSTNVIIPEVSLITNIGMDHMNLLGNTLDKIAFEKAGIIKQNVPIVVSETLPETRLVFEKKALEVNAPIYFAQEIYAVEKVQSYLLSLFVWIKEKSHNKSTKYELDLPGIYQTRNIAGVLEVVSQLKSRGWNIEEKDILNALKNVKGLTGLHGRWELINEKPLIIADVGHNEDGIKQIVQQLKNMSYKHLRLIIGFVKDKDISGVLNILPKEATYYFTKAQIPRALNELELAKLAHEKELRGQSFENIDLALLSAREGFQEGDLILICGSVFLVAEIQV
ncbi:bifunctional folylpolyglutamate synthase/dihydrofolate synthase, partial [Arachidicoccus sp.]|uniref:bifunctional folylpolyglutamate synthase/dihydrofolate synthase n=1 Tax=Arachidicoccus sp. TaxID=1872624 RepID=UPI003D263BF8